MLEIIEENFKKAIANDEFDKFIRGTGEYLIPSKDSYNPYSTNPDDLIRGLENICLKYPELNLNAFLETNLIIMLDSENFLNTYAVLGFVVAYLRRISYKEDVLKLDLEEILEKSKSKITEQKPLMENYREGVFAQEGMYSLVESTAYDLELEGHKILLTE